jgi:hypothetical protein
MVKQFQKLGSTSPFTFRQKFNFKNITTTPLDIAGSRAASAAALIDMVQDWKALFDIELGALHGPGSVTDLLHEFGFGGKPGNVIGRQTPPDQGFTHPGMADAEIDRINAGLPTRRHHRSTAGLGVPSFDDIQSGLAMDSPRPVPGQSSSSVSAGGKWHSSLMTDGSRVTTGEGWRGGAYHVFNSTESATGESTTTTVITTTDGRTATFTYSTGGTTNPHGTATGDPQVIAQEQARVDAGGGDEFDEAPPTTSPQPAPMPEPAPEPDEEPPGSITIDVDPGAPSASPWGYFNPFTGQYWGPYRKLNPNQVNPGPERSEPAGPSLRLDPKILVVNPNPDAMTSHGPPILTDPTNLSTGPGARPPRPKNK